MSGGFNSFWPGDDAREGALLSLGSPVDGIERVLGEVEPLWLKYHPPLLPAERRRGDYTPRCLICCQPPEHELHSEPYGYRT